jgi:hypothetical protein
MDIDPQKYKYVFIFILILICFMVYKIQFTDYSNKSLDYFASKQNYTFKNIEKYKKSAE